MTDPALDDIVRRAASEHRMVRDDVLTADVPALVAALREARAEVERLALVVTSLTAMVEAKSSWIDGARIDIDGLEAERDDARAAIAAVRALHVERAGMAGCRECGYDWPCPTAAVLARVEGDES